MLFLENSSSFVNVDSMPQKYGHVYTRCAKSIVDVPVVPISLITDTTSSKNTAIPFPYVDIDSSVDIDSQSDLNISSYAHVSIQYRAFVSFIDSYLVPKSVSNVMSNPGRRAVIGR